MSTFERHGGTPAEPELYAMTRRELATVLCALRLFQNTPGADICEHFVEDRALTDTEIDVLCEHLNTTPLGFPRLDGESAHDLR